MTKDEIKQLVLDHGLNVVGLIEAIIEMYGFNGVGLMALGDSLKNYCYNKLKGKSARSSSSIQSLKKASWTLTDPSTNQYGRQLSPLQFEFKEDNQEAAVINLNDYKFGEIESSINSFGYTLFDSTKGNRNITELYGPASQWIIAECLYELRS